MPPIIEIQKLGKKYSIAPVQRYLALRDVVSESVKNIFRKNSNHSNEFWALKDIDLKIEKGERVGIIGSNGAGKTTFLKILSKITPPTTGEVKLRGRVASLLEVGTGFHPELTGRENIYLNGSILGLTKKEINKKLDEIIDFSGVEKFIDTPLKHYSSGMQLRLAFSVAAHLEPEILVIDEVLAVGDIEFQKKCLGKMEEVSKTDGRTILFVSHNLYMLQNLCQTCVLLDNGRLMNKGPAASILDEYRHRYKDYNNSLWKQLNKKVTGFTQISLLNERNDLINGSISNQQQLFLQISLQAEKPIANSLIAVRLTDADSIAIFTTTNADAIKKFPEIEKGHHTYLLPIPVGLLTPGQYSFVVSWNIPGLEEIDVVKDEVSFSIHDASYPGNYFQDGRLGILNVLSKWEKQ